MGFIDFLKGFSAFALVLVPGAILLFIDVSLQRAKVEKNRRFLSYSILMVYLVSLLHFLGFLYVKSYYIVMGIQSSLPLLSRFVIHPITHHILIGIGVFFSIILLFVSKRKRDRKKGFNVSVMISLLLTVCFWFLALLFNMGMNNRLLVGEYVTSRIFIPLYALIALGISYIFVLLFIFWYVKRRRTFWFITVLVLSCGLIAFYFFSWYLPLLARTPVIR